ncbi:MAG: tRNA lysidine(34) synthetase TilS [Methylotenera sp.]|nr:tRNA lysidine(34) synthetase TilS [Methylotenera sp.]
MANLKKLPKNKAAVTSLRLKKATAEVTVHPLVIQLQHTLNHYLSAGLLPENAKLLLALSGGLDSTVLLHLLVAVQGYIPFELRALHVHHGLSQNADVWAEFCVLQCQKLNIPLQVVKVHVNQASKSGVEAEARRQRYEALFNYKVDNELSDFVVTAHHQDDQAETLLLQLFRGAGVKGLASMAHIDCNKRLLRPLLGVSRAMLLEYAQAHHIDWCDDESNDNTQFERNFVRFKLMPILESRYESIKPTLARTASHLAEADEMLQALAKLDAEPLLLDNTLCLQGLCQLDFARAKNVLRWWFSQHQLAMPNTEHLTEILAQLLNAKKEAELSIQLQHLWLKRYQQRAFLCAETNADPFDLLWQGEGELPLPNGGTLHFAQVRGHGLAFKHGIQKLRITNRDGGERFKPNALRPTRTLKHLLQEANMPPWQRVKIPLIYWNDTLACVPNIGVAHEFQASEAEMGLQITWLDN